MRYFICIALLVVVRGDVIQFPLLESSGIQTVADIVGPVTYVEDPSAGQRIADFAKKYYVGLRENEEDVTNEDNFVYPCGCNENEYDYDCIRDFFAKNSNCTRVYGPVPEPLVFAQYTAFFPSVNMTGTYANVTFKGLNNVTVCTFYYNKKTGNLVFAIKIPVFYASSSEIFFTYRRPCRENIFKSGSAKITYKSLIFTAIIPVVAPYGTLRLDLADINCYFEDSKPELDIDPSLINSTNPDVLAQAKSLLENLSIANRELFYFQSQLLTAIFIQTNICDFGVELYSL